METSRKRKADTYVVGFQGCRVVGGPNEHSVQYNPQDMSLESQDALLSAPSLEHVMIVASILEAGWLEMGMNDELVSLRNVAVSWGMSRMQLEVAGYLP